MSLKSRAVALLGLATLALCAITPAALADSGGLDTGFGTGGKTTLPASLGTTTVNDSVMLSNGSVAITGNAGTAPNRNAFVAKFTPSGVLDTTFNAAGPVPGVLTIDAGGDDVGVGLSARSNGGFVVSGGNNPDLVALSTLGFIAETTAAGTLDAAWGTGGVAMIDDPLAGQNVAQVAHAIEETPGGNVVFGAYYDETNLIVYGTVTSDGQFQSNPGASSSTFYATNAVPNILGLYHRSNGDWELVVASSDLGNTTTDIEVRTFQPVPGSTPIGVLNPPATTISGATFLSDLVPLTDDGFLLPGATAPSPAGTKRGTLWRYTAAAIPDSSFGTAGTLQLPAAADGFFATGVAPDSTGKWYVVGDLGTDRIRTVRLTSTFTPDTAFAQGGIADRSYGASPNRSNDVFVDSSDRPVETGTLGTAAAVWRVERFNYAAFTLGKVTFSPSFVQRLNTVTFNYSVTNTGPDTSGVTVDIDIPASFEGQTYTASVGTVAPVADGSGGTWTIPALASGATATLKLVGRPGDTGTLTTTASVTGQTTVRTGAAPAPQSTSVMVFGAGTPRDDVITGTPRRDIIDALQGNDIVHALAGNDWVNGNDGNDKVYGEAGNDTVLGGNGDDLVDGGTGNDKVDGGTGNDVVDGGSGDDKVAGGEGNDRLYGRTGNDRLNSGSGNDKVFAGPGNDSVFGGTGADRLYGETGDDYLIAQGAGDKLYGGPGRDRLDGGADDDQISGGTGDDWINGKTGDDVMNGNNGSDWIRGFAGDDLLIGGSGNDLLNGGAGHDTFRAGSGDDIVRADDGFGGDVINCGSGWDLVYANPGDSVASNCEYVKYDVPAGTRFSGDRGAGAVAAFARRHG